MIIAPQQDYPLSKNITALETYMFMTTEKFITQHSYFPHRSFSIFENRGRVSFLLDELEARKNGRCVIIEL